MSLLTVGSVAFDAIETPFGKTDKIVGGAGTYIALAASFFQPKQRIVSIIGEDFPQDELAFMASKGVDTNGIELVKGGKTFFWSGKYHNDMNSRDTLATELNVLEHFNPRLSQDDQADFVMLGNLTPAVQKSVVDQMESRPTMVAMDTMNFWMDIAMDDLKEVLKVVDMLIINDEEARQLSGEYSLVKAAEVIKKMGPTYLIIKKGEHGALLFHPEGLFSAPALPLEEVFDPTGAGDTFAGGLMGYISAEGKTDFSTMKRAVIAGSALASFCVEKFGTERLKEISRPEMVERMQSFHRLTNYEPLAV